MAQLTPWLVQKFYETDGITPAVGHQIFTYEPGTSTKKQTLDSDGGSPNTNPIITDSNGEADIWLEGAYKIVQAPADDTDPPVSPVKTWDNVGQDSTEGNFGIVDTYAELKALAEGEFEVVQILGYNSVSDRGTGYYRWDSTSNLADNGLTIVEPTISDGIGRWIRIYLEDYKPESLTDLRSVYPGSLSFIYLGGYTALADGGEGYFYWDSVSTETDNGGTIITPSAGGTGRWIRIYAGIINLKWFGATGDGTTNDSTAINNCTAYALASDKAIFAPAGTYYCESSIILGVTNTQSTSGSRGIKGLYGEATDLTIFKFSNSGTVGLDYSGARYFNLEKLTIEGSVTNPPNVGLLLSRVDREAAQAQQNAASVSESWIKDVEFRGYFTLSAFYNYAAEETHLTRCTFENKQTDATATIIVTDTNYYSVTSTNASLPGANTWRKQSCIGHYFHGCRIFDYTASTATDYGCMFYGATSVHITDMSNYTMFNGVTASRLFQVDQDTTVYTEASDTGGQPSDIIFDGVFYHETTDETTVYINCTVAGLSHIRCRGGGTTGIVCATGIDIAGATGAGEHNVIECFSFDGSAADVDVFATDIYISDTFSISDFFVGGSVHVPEGGATINITDPTRFLGQIYNDAGNTGGLATQSINTIDSDGKISFTKATKDIIRVENAVLNIGEETAGQTQLEVSDLTLETVATYYGIRSRYIKTGGATDEADDIHALYLTMALNQSGGTIGYLYGIFNDVTLTDGTIGDGQENLVGIWSRAKMEGGTAANDVVGARITSDINLGEVTNDIIGAQIIADIEASVTSIGGNIYGIYLQVDADLDPTGNCYALYIDDQDNVDYAIFQAGTADSILKGLVSHGSEDAITASTTQSQGEGPLTKNINEISVCANAGNVVTLPTAVGGTRVFIKNNGAQSCDVYPALGNQLDAAGLNTAVALAAGASITYNAVNATTWYS